ncbi:sigma-54 dependent transcriptional regulator [Roseobacter sp. YSTF-M11]|uniref:Nif-specific regulatory protein n=1 Tax=Roseobacter insulae TaxID=2859783 RepID=A0A9X1G023_9RHOB|nr:sigma-54 dependent transcriptional regulator [Roseobacter insulae]MBW4710449.1 sigma-54 dependent transcriptional regulator [Roseobacter insulae]
MTSNAAHVLTLVSQESGDTFDALVRVLGELDYRLNLVPPTQMPKAAHGQPSLIYLGDSGWSPNAMHRLRNGAVEPAHLLALEKTAFRWAEPVIRNSRDFVTWPCGRSELKLRLERSCVAPSGDVSVQDVLRQKRSAPVRALGLVGRSSVFLDSLLTLARFAECDAAVLIHGETGTGKELAARAIHRLSRRKSGPFVPVCCGALPDSLIEAELFGHARGAFTDAREARSGLVAQAESGTLFLDEVEALSAKAQAALLRFLESLEYRRVGGNRSRKADLRVIAAGNEDLHLLARHGEFRSDLLYRLNVLSLSLPPLRLRGADSELLAEHFLTKFAGSYDTGPLTLTPESRIHLSTYGWPGNVRELENTVHRAVVTATGQSVTLTPDAGPDCGADAQPQAFGAAKRKAIDTFEKGYLLSLMRAAQGNVTRAARHAGKERRALGKLLKKHKIDTSAFQENADDMPAQEGV